MNEASKSRDIYSCANKLVVLVVVVMMMMDRSPWSV